MRLIKQDGFPNACQQACIAMLGNVGINDVIALVGPERLDMVKRLEACEHFGITFDEDGWSSLVVEAFGNQTIGALARQHETLWLTVSDYLNPSFGHATLLHQGTLYDPLCGENPMWPWSRYVSTAKIIFPKGS